VTGRAGDSEANSASARVSFSFDVLATHGRARAGAFRTPRGTVETPVFMPVGTLATVKALDPEDLRAMHAQMILANAYHLHLRPGDEVIRDLGGLHRFMAWHGPILTDSGGFQVFSLASLNSVTEDGVTFRSHLDGSERHFTPESVMRIEANLGADVIMQFDHVIPGQSDRAAAEDASERSIRWLERCAAEFARLSQGTTGTPGAASGAAPLETQALFPIVQGGVFPDLRREAATRIASAGAWHGIAIGGLSVGEEKPAMYGMLEACDDALPRDKPRYLMGVGFPEDLIEGVARGVDLFDCVAPTRMGRNGAAFTSRGRLNLKNAAHRLDDRPIEEACGCSTCRRFSRAYLRHLVQADEILGLTLLSVHNVHFLVAMMRHARATIADGTFDRWSRDWLSRYHSTDEIP